MQRSGTREGNPALRVGLMMGIIVGIILLVGVLLDNLDTLAPLRTFSPLVSSLEFIVAMTLYLLAGLRVSQQTGRVRTGALAGLIAGLTASLIKFTMASILILPHLDTMRQHLLSQAPSGLERQFATTPFIIGVLLFADGIGIVVEFALGAGAGAIGGLIGKRRAPVPT